MEEIKVYEIWMEGYAATGEHGIHRLIGRVEAGSFKEACKKAVIEWLGDRCEREYHYFDEEKCTFWGCRMFDNEEDAARAFG